MAYRIREATKIKRLFTKLLESPLVQFPESYEKIDAPKAQGVYIIYSPRGRVMHVGRTQRGKNGLAQRLTNHLQARSSFTNQYLGRQGHLLRDGYGFRCIAIKRPRTRALLEHFAIGALCPAHIGLGIKREP